MDAGEGSALPSTGMFKNLGSKAYYAPEIFGIAYPEGS